MRLLLDTHVVLWALSDPARLGEEARTAIVDRDNQIAVSAATGWEVAIKRSRGKLELPGGVKDWFIGAVEDLGAQWLTIRADEAAGVETLPDHHRDPFDRLLVAQAAAGGWTLVSADDVFAAYPVAFMRA